MSQNKLATNPWSPTISSGRKILRTRNGKALNRLKSPYRIFWTYDDGGENDPYLVGYYDGGGMIFGYFFNQYLTPGRINLPGDLPIYTNKVSNVEIFAQWSPRYEIKTHYWALIYDPSSEGRARGMTFWLLGEKIHIIAKRSSLVHDAETYLGYVTNPEEPVDGQPEKIAVNGVYRGVWPPFLI